MAAQGATLNHVSLGSPDIERLAQFYQEILGFEKATPDFGIGVIWLKLNPSFYFHLIQRDPTTKLPEGPSTDVSAVKEPLKLPRSHHIAFTVANFDSFVQTLKEKGIQAYERPRPDGKPNSKQVFFFDPDGNGLEVTNQ